MFPFQIQKEEGREAARWSAQSLASLSSLKIDLPRVPNGSSGSNGGNASCYSGTGASSKPSASFYGPTNLPRVVAGQRKSLTATKSYGGPSSDHHVTVGSSPQDPILMESTRRRRQIGNDDRRRKTVAHFGPRSLPAGGSDIPRAPIATPAERGDTKLPSAAPLPEEKLSAPPLHFSPTSDRQEGSRSCEDQNFVSFNVRHHPHRHSIGFLRPANRGEVSNDVSFNVDSSVDDDFDVGGAGASFPGHYQSPKDRDGDYSYAYDCSVSPAFLIRWNGAVDEMYRDEDEEAKTENIYEEIDKKVDPDGKADTNANGGNDVDDDDEDFHEKGMSDGNSSRKSSSLNSDSGIGASGGSRHRVVAKLGTLDVTQRGPYKKKEVTINENSFKESQKSSLDVLLSKTTQGMSPDERMNLRKSLVDELFEELIQRHHSRVLEQLRLDVEEFIAPTPTPMPGKSEGETQEKSSSSQKESPFQRSKSTTGSKLFVLRREKSGTVASRRSVSSTSPRRLRKCESIDFKEILSSESGSPAVTTRRHNNASSSNVDSVTVDATQSKSKRNPATQIFTSARKYSEAIHRKYFSRSSAAKAKQQQQQQQQLLQQQPSQVSRRGRRPLSAFLTRTSISDVIGTDVDEMDDSDSEEESARRLQRSKIIQSFLREQDNQENNNNNSSGHGSVSSKRH